MWARTGFRWGKQYVQLRHGQPLCRGLYQFLARTLLEFCRQGERPVFQWKLFAHWEAIGDKWWLHMAENASWKPIHIDYGPAVAGPHSKRAACQQSSPSRHLQCFSWPTCASVTPKTCTRHPGSKALNTTRQNPATVFGCSSSLAILGFHLKNKRAKEQRYNFDGQ